jgi:hypothetical protein
MNTQDKLKNLINQARVDTSDHTDQRILKPALDLLCEPETEESTQKGRWLMLRRISQLSIAALVLFAVILGVGNLGQDSLAFASVLEYLQRTSYAFDLSVSSSETDESPGSFQAKIQQPGRMRIDFEIGRCPISAMIDMDSGESLILYHAYKTANWVQTNEAFQEVGESGLFLLSARPVENLWSLQDGTEKKLGKRSIKGRKARGFSVQQSDDHFRHTMTIWADITTGEPLEVKIVSAPHEDSTFELIFLLTHFDMQSPTDDLIFSMEVPETYRLEGRVQLKDLDFAPQESEQARRIVKVLALWKEDSKTEAIDELLAVDWDQPIVFVERPYAFTLSEMDMVMLSNSERDVVMAEVEPMCATLRKICFELKRLGDEAQSSEDLTKAEQCFRACVRLGQCLPEQTDSMVIVRMVGIAMRAVGLGGLESLYEQTNQTEELEAVQQHQDRLKAELNAIKNMRK